MAVGKSAIQTELNFPWFHDETSGGMTTLLHSDHGWFQSDKSIAKIQRHIMSAISFKKIPNLMPSDSTVIMIGLELYA